jgi:signal transduction histidine kinase
MREILRRRAHLLPGLLLWAVLAAATVVDVVSTRSSPLVETAAALLCLTAAVVLSRRRPGAAVATAVAFPVAQQVAFVVGLVDGLSLVPLATAAVTAFLAGQRSARVGPVATIALTVVLALLGLVVAESVFSGHDVRDFLSRLVDWLGAAIIAVLVLVAPWLLGRYLPWHARLSRGGWEVAERMERARAADAERARLRERARIASRMHDSLGHDLALLAVRAAALEMASADSPERREAAAELRASAHEAGLRLREIIGVLREGDDEPSAEPVADLVRRATDAGMAVRLLREGPDPVPGGPGGRAVHRVVQEALTNAAKYAPGAEVSVTVVRAADRTCVEVEDTGPAGSGGDGSDVTSGTGESLGTSGTSGSREGGGTGRTSGSGGTGLAALRELVVGLGGSFHAAGTARGFAVRATLPDPPRDGGDGPDPASSANVLAPSGPGQGHGGPALGDEPSETRRAHDEARGHARRSLTTAVAVPLALTASLVGLAFLLLWWVSANSVLPPQDYDRLSVGDDRSEVERVLPRFAYPERSVDPLPPRPPGAECRFYLVSSEGGLPPVYRLCFADGVLVAKDEFERTDD